MTWHLLWTHPALEDIDALDAGDARRVHTALTRLARSHRGDYKQLTGSTPSTWRLRVGRLRVRFRYIQSTKQILVLRVLPRGSAYLRLPCHRPITGPRRRLTPDALVVPISPAPAPA